ncbi:iron-siderophore ABC transporter substrate-binding protein [Labrys okinawensis]|uniref:iron-siderophore ABC transporter substrate-binding protein n=1 Tax=Labrys okinawensis TaxID=346911 RepID=UPI0039BC94DC
MTRRAMAGRLLAGALVAALPVPGHALDPQPTGVPRRIVALDWTAAAMLLSLGAAPAGVGDAELYRIWVAEPALPPDTPDLGLRDAPNPEIIAALKPDLILVSPLGAATRPLLERIAPTFEVSIAGGGDVLAEAGTQLRLLGRLLERGPEADKVIADSNARFGALRARLGPAARRRPLVVQFLDARFVRVYGHGSMPGAALERLGLTNAWTRPVNDWGFALVGTEKLAAFPDADIVVVDPLPAGVTIAPDPASLWGNLPSVRQGRVRHLPAVWTFGEITAANRFATLLVDRLGSGDARF